MFSTGALAESVRASWAKQHSHSDASGLLLPPPSIDAPAANDNRKPKGKRDWVQTLNSLGLDMDAFRNGSGSGSGAGVATAAALDAIVADVERVGGHLQTGEKRPLYPLTFSMKTIIHQERLGTTKRKLPNTGHNIIELRVRSLSGIIGTKYLFRSLSLHGRADIAWAVASTPEFPGYGWMIEQGATSLWENWQGTRFQPGGVERTLSVASQRFGITFNLNWLTKTHSGRHFKFKIGKLKMNVMKRVCFL